MGDSEDAIRAVIETGGYGFPVMVDPGSVGTEYNITAIPTVVVLDSTGTVAKRITGLVSADELNDLVTDLTER